MCCIRTAASLGIPTLYAISAYHHWCCEFECRSGRGVQHYVIMFVSFLHQWNWPPRYNWNIVESGVKHHKTNKSLSRCYQTCVWPTSFATHECIQHHITISSPIDNGSFLEKVPPISYVIFTCCENIVEVFESLTTCFWTMDTSLFSGHLGAFDALSHLILSLQ